MGAEFHHFHRYDCRHSKEASSLVQCALERLDGRLGWTDSVPPDDWFSEEVKQFDESWHPRPVEATQSHDDSKSEE